MRFLRSSIEVLLDTDIDELHGGFWLARRERRILAQVLSEPKATPEEMELWHAETEALLALSELEGAMIKMEREECAWIRGIADALERVEQQAERRGWVWQ